MERPDSLSSVSSGHGTLTPPVIIGAGIGGLALALFLARRGICCAVYEREKTFSGLGNGLQLGPNVNALLHTHLPEIDAAIAAAATEPDAVCFYDGITGKPLKSLALGRTARSRWGAPFRVIHRADLHAILLTAASKNPSITLHHNHQLSSIQTHPENTNLVFENEGKTVQTTARLLIGADGVNSAVRKVLKAPPPQNTGQAAWRALIPGRAFPFEWGRNNTGLWMAPKMHLVHYPIRQGAWINAVLTAPETITDIPLNHMFGRDAARILHAPSEGWTAWPLRTLIPHFGAGNILLLGDSSHAMAPHLAQGAAQAIEDAALLACLIAERIPLNQLAAAYSAARYTRIAAIQKASTSKGKLYRMGAPLSVVRNTVLRLTPTPLLYRSLDWLFRNPQ